MRLPPFLQALGFDAEAAATADERSIRRAYAKRLKQIDIEADPAAFQALRETLEHSLRWAAWRQRQQQAQEEAEDVSVPAQVTVPEASADVTPPSDAAPASPVAPTPTESPAPSETASDFGHEAGTVAAPPPEPAPPTFEAVADAVFRDFVRGLRTGTNDEAAARALLAAALADERLVNVDARVFFEWRVACMLMNGWMPGHQFVFKPACYVFHWETDRRRLGVYGQVGAALDTAIRERLLFYGLPRAEFEALRELIIALRSDRPVDTRRLAREMPRLNLLVQRYPNWLGIVTSRDNIRARFDQWNALPPEQRPALPAPASAKKPPPKKITFMPAAVVMSVIMVIRLIIAAAEPSSNSGRGPLDQRSTRTQAESALPERQREAEAALQRALEVARAGNGAAPTPHAR